MAFRTSDNLQRNELVRFHLDNLIDQPINGQSQKKTDYRFTINDRSTFFDFFNAFFEVDFQVQKIADGTGYNSGNNNVDKITMINGSHSLIKHLVIKSSGKIIYDSDNLHRITNVKNLLEYSDDYRRSVAKNTFFYLDSSDSVENTNVGFYSRRQLTAELGNVNTIIPLNRYSFFKELETQMMPPMQLTFEITLNNDSELIHKHADAPNGRVVITCFNLWIPRLIPKDSMYSTFISEFLKPTKWTYLRDLYNQSANTRAIQNIFQISPAIDDVQKVFVFLSRTSGPNNMEYERTPYIFNTFKLNSADNNCTISTCRLEYGQNTFYPELEYDSDSKIRIFNDLMNYSYRKNDYNSGTLLNISNFTKLYGLIYFDLSYQKENITRDPKQLIFHYRLNTVPTENIRAYSIVFYRTEVIIDKIGNELMIV